LKSYSFCTIINSKTFWLLLKEQGGCLLQVNMLDEKLISNSPPPPPTHPPLCG
jgi:hypothetical protein